MLTYGKRVPVLMLYQCTNQKILFCFSFSTKIIFVHSNAAYVI